MTRIRLMCQIHSSIDMKWRNIRNSLCYLLLCLSASCSAANPASQHCRLSNRSSAAARPSQFYVQVASQPPALPVWLVPLYVELKPGVFSEPGGRLISMAWVRRLIYVQSTDDALDHIVIVLKVPSETPPIPAQSAIKSIMLIKDEYESLKPHKCMLIYLMSSN